MNAKKQLVYLFDEDATDIKTAQYSLEALIQLRHILSLKVYQHSESALILQVRCLLQQFEVLEALPASLLLKLWRCIQRRAQQRQHFLITEYIFGNEDKPSVSEEALYLALAITELETALGALKRLRRKIELKDKQEGFYYRLNMLQRQLYSTLKRSHKAYRKRQNKLNILKLSDDI
jgi:hypothetical protein